MRSPLDRHLLEKSLQLIAKQSQGEGKVYLTGGACAVYEGWRSATLDIDLKIDPEPSGIFESIQFVKRHCQVNIELASPSDFIPEVPGWKERSVWIKRYGSIDVFHYDFLSQALSKIERSSEQDLVDVQSILTHQNVKTNDLLNAFNQIRPLMIRYPRLNDNAFERKLMEVVRLWQSQIKT